MATDVEEFYVPLIKAGDTKKKSTKKKPAKKKAKPKSKVSGKEGVDEEPVFEASKLDQAAMDNTFAGKKMKPGSTSLSNLQRKNNRRTISPTKYTRPPYEDE